MRGVVFQTAPRVSIISILSISTNGTRIQRRFYLELMPFKSLRSLTHDVLVYGWGVFTNHPNYKETEFGIIWPIEIHRKSCLYGLRFEVSLCWPQCHVLNALEMEADYLNRRQQRV